MNHDRAFAVSRLLGLAAQLDRGAFDHELGEGAPAAGKHWARLIAERCRQRAAAIEDGER